MSTYGTEDIITTMEDAASMIVTLTVRVLKAEAETARLRLVAARYRSEAAQWHLKYLDALEDGS